MPSPTEQVSEDFNADQARELASAYHNDKKNASRAQLPTVLAKIKKLAEYGHNVVTVSVSADLPTSPLIEELEKRGFKAVIASGYSTLEVSWK